MSRYYEALKQASRSSNHVNGNGGGHAIPVFTVEDLAPALPPAVPDLPEHREEPVSEKFDAWALSPEQPSEQSAVRKPGTPTKISIDKTARVIPNLADHVVIEHYRRLRTKLMQQHEAEAFRTLLVTSASPQEGKSVTVLNLALSFSMLPSFRVAVVDGDLRRGTLGQWVGLDNRPGLSDLIEGTAALEDVVFRSDNVSVHYIVRGNSKLPAAELLHSPQLGRHIQSMTQHFDLVLIDSPPVNLITDTHILAANCDAVLLVARAFSTTCKSFEKAAQELSGRRIVGAVLNGGTREQNYGKYNGYY